ncbi:MAG: peptide-methionine (S)-S-oxide reductase [Candidatus Methanoperedens sp.]
MLLQRREIATLAGGCFWCLEAIFNELRGVEKVVLLLRMLFAQPIISRSLHGGKQSC